VNVLSRQNLKAAPVLASSALAVLLAGGCGGTEAARDDARGTEKGGPETGGETRVIPGSDASVDAGGRCLTEPDGAAATAAEGGASGRKDASETATIDAPLPPAGDAPAHDEGDAAPDAAAGGDGAVEGGGRPDSGPAADSGSPPPCPDDMVYVPADTQSSLVAAFCVDRFEASRRDATATSQGTDESIALSVAGVIPWFENPMTLEGLARFEAACTAAGKRLCTSQEWFATCTGPDGTRYAFGNTFDREICNCVDTFCDDYCREQGIATNLCNLSSNCGYTCGTSSDPVECLHVTPTGAFPKCTNALGTFDVNGNLWEVVPSSDERGYEVRGGAFNCAGAAARLQCDFNAAWDALYAGFRCCKDAGR